MRKFDRETVKQVLIGMKLSISDNLITRACILANQAWTSPDANDKQLGLDDETINDFRARLSIVDGTNRKNALGIKGALMRLYEP